MIRGSLRLLRFFVKVISVLLAGPVLVHFGKPFAFGVGMIVEVEKQDQKDQPVQTDNVEKHWKLVRTIFHEEELADVSGHQRKLNLRSKAWSS